MRKHSAGLTERVKEVKLCHGCQVGKAIDRQGSLDKIE